MRNRFSQWRIGTVGLMAALSLGGAARAQVTVFAQDLAGFNAAAGNPPVAINFDGITPGTDIGGQTIAGVLFQALGSPLIVVRGADTVTNGPDYGGSAPNPDTNKLFPTSGENVLSPGGTTLGPGSNPAIEQDSLELIFSTPLSAFGFDHLSQSADGFSFTSIQVFNAANVSLFAGTVPISNLGGGGAPGGADFWGIVSENADIARIVITEGDGDGTFPDNNIGFDTFRFVAAGNGANAPEPATIGLVGMCLIPLASRRLRRKR